MPTTVALRLDDELREWRLQALWTLKKLEPATLARRANAVIELLHGDDDVVYKMALRTLEVLPRFIITGSILDPRPDEEASEKR